MRIPLLILALGALGAAEAGTHTGPPPPGVHPPAGGTGSTDGTTPPGAPSKAQMEQTLQEVFTTADADASGGLTPTEFDAALKALHEKIVANGPKGPPPRGDQGNANPGQGAPPPPRGDQGNANPGQGAPPPRGDQTGTKPPPPKPEEEAKRAEARAKAFTGADANHDGVLSLGEFKAAVHQLGANRPPPPPPKPHSGE